MYFELRNIFRGNFFQQNTMTTNDFQLATKSIFMYKLFVGYEEFDMTYNDIVEFYKTTTDPLQIIVMQETLNDLDAYIYNTREKGFF
jgi:hypothetical protein